MGSGEWLKGWAGTVECGLSNFSPPFLSVVSFQSCVYSAYAVYLFCLFVLKMLQNAFRRTLGYNMDPLTWTGWVVPFPVYNHLG